MAFMRKDVNMGLLLLIIATLLLFSGFTVYYQTNFRDVVGEYNEKLSQLQQVKDELLSEKTRLNQTYELRIKAERDIEALDSQYKDLSDERDRLESDKNSLQSELSSTKGELASNKAELSQVNDLLSTTQAELTITSSRLVSCNREVEDLEDDLEACQSG